MQEVLVPPFGAYVPVNSVQTEQQCWASIRVHQASIDVKKELPSTLHVSPAPFNCREPISHVEQVAISLVTRQMKGSC
jgi:hypothetical protein